VVLTAARSSEARLATWHEIDEDARLWVIPASRIKIGTEHRQPLSDAAMNVLDRAAGRAAKAAGAWGLVWIAPGALLAAGSFRPFDLGPDTADWAVWSAAAVGASAGLLRSELAEQHMQGDTGVNPLGALLGMATVVAYSAAVEWVVLAILAVLNLASERWSFSRIIDAVPPLRWLDRLGSPYRN